MKQINLFIAILSILFFSCNDTIQKCSPYSVFNQFNSSPDTVILDSLYLESPFLKSIVNLSEEERSKDIVIPITVNNEVVYVNSLVLGGVRTGSISPRFEVWVNANNKIYCYPHGQIEQLDSIGNLFLKYYLNNGKTLNLSSSPQDAFIQLKFEKNSSIKLINNILETCYFEYINILPFDPCHVRIDSLEYFHSTFPFQMIFKSTLPPPPPPPSNISL